MGSYADFHARSINDRDAFWAEQAKLVDWKVLPQQICDYSNPPFAKWFVGGQTNLCHNAVDRHLAERADQPALIFVSTETDQEKIYTFRDLHAEVQRMAAILKDLGVVKGDNVVDVTINELAPTGLEPLVFQHVLPINCEPSVMVPPVPVDAALPTDTSVVVDQQQPTQPLFVLLVQACSLQA